MQGSEYRNRGDGGAGEIGRDILRDAGKAEDVDVKHLAGLPRRFEIRAGVGSQNEVQAFAAPDCAFYAPRSSKVPCICRRIWASGWWPVG